MEIGAKLTFLASTSGRVIRCSPVSDGADIEWEQNRAANHEQREIKKFTALFLFSLKGFTETVVR